MVLCDLARARHYESNSEEPMPETYQIIFGVALVVGGIIYFASIGRSLRKAEELRLADETGPPPVDEIFGRAEHNPQAGRWLEVLFKAIFGLASAAFLLAGLGVVGLQAFVWIRSGEWPPLSVIDVLRMFLDEPWLTAPKDWIGLHRILQFIPLSIGLCSLGTVMLLMIFSDD